VIKEVKTGTCERGVPEPCSPFAIQRCADLGMTPRHVPPSLPAPAGRSAAPWPVAGVRGVGSPHPATDRLRTWLRECTPLTAGSDCGTSLQNPLLFDGLFWLRMFFRRTRLCAIGTRSCYRPVVGS
jgi:hypothetical protein